MGKRLKEPVEAIEPAVNGFEDHLLSFSEPDNGEEEELALPMVEEREEEPAPCLLIFGQGPDAEALGELAGKCGFSVLSASVEDGSGAVDWADSVCRLENFEHIVKDCGIEKNYFICIFEPGADVCELLLSQCLASDASYIGLDGDAEKIAEIFEELRQDGVPDAELAAVAAPVGLNIGARSPDEKAVAIVAEMLAAKGGKLKRLAHQGSSRK